MEIDWQAERIGKPRGWPGKGQGRAVGQRFRGSGPINHHAARSLTVLGLALQALLGKSTRESMIGWLAATIDGNEERGKMISDLQKAASHGR